MNSVSNASEYIWISLIIRKALLGSNYHIQDLCQRIATIPESESITFLMKDDVCRLIHESIE